ncbi:hemolysin family protein [Calidifontibacillus oryziterrae]|uniref:hemolysin family protein n=1 Tax=Calidifontibacillus oryziterrae TaxID=1191699 RepID=UPI0002E918F2|nr:hemolysin family protein [Calidifontibacillus oryziterrae]
MEIISLIMVGVLIAISGFFVASEFAVVKIRSSRIEQLIEEGNTKAISAKKVVDNLDEYLSACQLGITITSLGLGWIGEPAVEHLLHPVFEKLQISPALSTVLSFVIAFSVITFLHVVIGELAPKTLAIQKAEAVTLTFAKPLMIFYKVMYPFIWILNSSARAFTKMFGLGIASEHEIAHSEEELRLILSESFESGEINQSEYDYVNNIFEFDNRLAKEIMVPRTEVIALDKDQTIKEVLNTLHMEKYTRYPVIDGDKDHVIGLLNIKEIFSDFVTGAVTENTTIEQYARPIIKIIDSIPIHDLLLKMQKERIHMSILVDEYGGTSGLVTVEDILEEIVGEIQDEFDEDEIPSIQQIDDAHTIIEGKVLVSDVNDLFHIDIDESEVDTIGGWILTENFDIHQGESIYFDNYEFKVIEMEEQKIKSIEVIKHELSEKTIDEGV